MEKIKYVYKLNRWFIATIDWMCGKKLWVPVMQEKNPDIYKDMNLDNVWEFENISLVPNVMRYRTYKDFENLLRLIPKDKFKNNRDIDDLNNYKRLKTRLNLMVEEVENIKETSDLALTFSMFVLDWWEVVQISCKNWTYSQSTICRVERDGMDEYAVVEYKYLEKFNNFLNMMNSTLNYQKILQRLDVCLEKVYVKLWDDEYSERFWNLKLLNICSPNDDISKMFDFNMVWTDYIIWIYADNIWLNELDFERDIVYAKILDYASLMYSDLLTDAELRSEINLAEALDNLKTLYPNRVKSRKNNK